MAEEKLNIFEWIAKEMDEHAKRYTSEHDFSFPLEISSIKKTRARIRHGHGGQIGDMVAIRPVDDEKTYLGMYLCDAPIDFLMEIEKETNTLEVSFYTNPAIYIPDLDRVVYGIESWWGKIESEEKLHEITDEDIENIWYVKALKQLAEEP